MIVGIPIVQLTLFGYAINTDPKHMPTAIIGADHSEMTRTMIATNQERSFHVLFTSVRRPSILAAARRVDGHPMDWIATARRTPSARA